MRSSLISFCIAIFLVLPTQAAFAQATDHEQLLAELQSFLLELNELKQQLQHMRTSAQEPRVLGASVRRLEPSKYFRGPYEAIYLTEGILLTPYGDTQQSRTDLDIWNLWRQIVGNQVVSTYITEFRLYRDDDAEFDAFVEEVTHDEWIFGVNLDGLDLTDAYNRDSVIELFVHEYAHILHHYHRDVVADFEDRYWDPPYRGDRYYISDYAQIDAEEDFAESFAHFVLDPRPHGDTVIDEKVRFFYRYDAFQDIREEIRERLDHS